MLTTPPPRATGDEGGATHRSTMMEFPARTSGAAPKFERVERERDERLRVALEWEKFEKWCASNGLPLPPATPEAVVMIALYVTQLAAVGRNVTTVARALLRDRQRKD